MTTFTPSDDLGRLLAGGAPAWSASPSSLVTLLHLAALRLESGDARAIDAEVAAAAIREAAHRIDVEAVGPVEIAEEGVIAAERLDAWGCDLPAN